MTLSPMFAMGVTRSPEILTALGGGGPPLPSPAAAQPSGDTYVSCRPHRTPKAPRQTWGVQIRQQAS